MPSTNPFRDPGLDPGLPFEQLADWLASAIVQGVLGLIAGLLAARLMRARHLHWSWAAVGLLPAALAGSNPSPATSILAIGALSGALWGRRWHREDIEAGVDLAEIAAGRLAPVQALRASLRRVALQRRCTSGAENWLRREELIIGCDESSRVVSVPFGGQGGGRHTLVVGATGSGKTYTQTWIAARAIAQGNGAIVVDPKGDRRMREEVCAAAKAAGRRYIEWTAQGSTIYNPYARGSDTEIADKALAGERFTEPHYLRQAQRYLGHAVRALRGSGSQVSLQAIVEQLDPERLELLARTLPASAADATHAYLDTLTARQRSELAGVRDRLAILAESEVGPWLDPRSTGAEHFDLLHAVRARAVVYFDLESDRRPLLTQMLGAAIVQDLQTVVASLQGRPVPTLVLIDEFSAVAAEQVVRLFGRARSAGFSLLLGTQELSDLRPPGRERLLEQVMGNLSALIAHRQVVPASAELIARVAGTRGVWRTQRSSDGRSTRSRGRETVLDASDAMSLRQGWGAVIVPGGGVRITRIFSGAERRIAPSSRKSSYDTKEDR
jgi:type IV secretion system coupling TraD/TrwB family protein